MYVCDFSSINQDGMGKQCINSAGVCAGLVWRKARLSLGAPPMPSYQLAEAAAGEDEEGTRLPTCRSATGTPRVCGGSPRQGHTALLSWALSRSFPMWAREVKLSAREGSGSSLQE